MPCYCFGLCDNYDDVLVYRSTWKYKDKENKICTIDIQKSKVRLKAPVYAILKSWLWYNFSEIYFYHIKDKNGNWQLRYWYLDQHNQEHIALDFNHKLYGFYINEAFLFRFPPSLKYPWPQLTDEERKPNKKYGPSYARYFPGFVNDGNVELHW